jgi:phage terminase small subunit
VEHILSDNERVFAENYVISLRKDLAAKAAGYSEHSARDIGYQVYQRPHVRAYIDKILDENTISAKETLKRISDTSGANMTDYLKLVKSWHTPTVKKSLHTLIEETKLYILAEQDYCDEKGLTEEDYDKFQAGLEVYRDRILRYQIELRYNPNAARLVDGESIEIETMELDLILITADKERGIVKSFKHTPNGISVEMCDPDTSKDRMAKIHGLYEKDNEQKKDTIHIIIDNKESQLGE